MLQLDFPQLHWATIDLFYIQRKLCNMLWIVHFWIVSSLVSPVVQCIVGITHSLVDLEWGSVILLVGYPFFSFISFYSCFCENTETFSFKYKHIFSSMPAFNYLSLISWFWSCLFQFSRICEFWDLTHGNCNVWNILMIKFYCWLNHCTLFLKGLNESHSQNGCICLRCSI